MVNVLYSGFRLDIRLRFPTVSPIQTIEVRGGPSYGGEQLTLFVPSTKIPEIQLRTDAMPVPEEVVQRWERQWGRGVKQVARDGDERVGSVSEVKAMTEGATMGGKKKRSETRITIRCSHRLKPLSRNQG